jgi:hypothetical protein
MNPQKTVKRILPIINLEHIFDFRSILFTIARFSNESQDYKMNLTQNFFNSLNFNTIDQFTKCFIEKKIEQDHSQNLSNQVKVFKDAILNNDLFYSVKPKLWTLSEIYFLYEISNKLDHDFEIILVYKENFFKDVIMKLLYLNEIQNIFESQNKKSKVKFIIKSEEEVINFLLKNNSSPSIKNIIIHIDNQKLNASENNEDIVFYSKYFNKHSDSKESDNFESVLKLICEKTLLNQDEIIKDYNEIKNKEFIFKYCKEFLSREFLFLNLWRNFKTIENIKISGKVVTGFKRGSKLLGVPTANIEMTEEIKNILKLVCTGVYFGNVKFVDDKEKESCVFRGVLSIGYNPYFENATKTIEVFLIDYDGEDFYDSIVEISIAGFLRTEAYFENFAELVTAITYDIIFSNKILS